MAITLNDNLTKKHNGSSTSILERAKIALSYWGILTSKGTPINDFAKNHPALAEFALPDEEAKNFLGFETPSPELRAAVKALIDGYNDDEGTTTNDVNVIAACIALYKASKRNTSKTISEDMALALFQRNKKAFKKAFSAMEMSCITTELPMDIAQGVGNADDAYDAYDAVCSKLFSFIELDHSKLNEEEIARITEWIGVLMTETLKGQNKIHPVDDKGNIKITDEEIKANIAIEERLTLCKVEYIEKLSKKEKLTQIAILQANIVNIDIHIGVRFALRKALKILSLTEEEKLTQIDSLKADIEEITKKHLEKLKKENPEKASVFVQKAMASMFKNYKEQLPGLHEKLQKSKKDQTAAFLQNQKTNTILQKCSYAGFWLKSFFVVLGEESDQVKNSKDMLEEAKSKIKTMKAAQGWIYGFYFTEDFKELLNAKVANRSIYTHCFTKDLQSICYTKVVNDTNCNLALSLKIKETEEVLGTKIITKISNLFKSSEGNSELNPAVTGDEKPLRPDGVGSQRYGALVRGRSTSNGDHHNASNRPMHAS